MKFWAETGSTLGVGDGDGEADVDADDEAVADEVGTGAFEVGAGSDGIGDNVGVGVGEADGDASTVGVPVGVGVLVADADATGISGEGEFSSAKVGAIFEKISATTIKAPKRIAKLKRRLCERELSGDICQS
ncbi:MAG: hypothetical protein F2690_00665 [Actinobacteria bacterium]|nr:hypothetical protein [Actinomycetota bacterium]MSX71567.1 hypothetical protein [Actinomycetota bacterium]MSY69071.1 hypothetical protein [Actinomycetota bacterium]MTA75512.1 hypothetical protein [Actinomycetota bacterium]